MAPLARVRRAVLRSIWRHPPVGFVLLAHPFEWLPDVPHRIVNYPGRVSVSERRLLVRCGALGRDSDQPI